MINHVVPYWNDQDLVKRCHIECNLRSKRYIRSFINEMMLKFGTCVQDTYIGNFG